jgi:endonuclease-3 related protein
MAPLFPTGLSVKNDIILMIYQRLFNRYGPQHWWPGETAFEVMVGAILTQSASWQNVEKAIANLKAAGVMSLPALRQLSLSELARLIHPSGYYNAKAVKLKALVDWLDIYCGDNPARLLATDAAELRLQLLSVYGIGQETADSILLYAARKPVFVIDNYTRRIISRLGLAPPEDRYSAYQTIFTENLPHDLSLFNEYHALLVCLGKNVCRREPLCNECSLFDICRYHKANLS